MTDITIDLAIRVKNGYMSKKSLIKGLYSKMNERILSILKEEGYIKNYSVIEDNVKKSLQIELLYENEQPSLTDVKIFSRPGQRVYKTIRQIRPVLGGMGIAILSTPKGVMTDKNARKQKTGGELLFELW